MTNHESDEQIALFAWADIQSGRYPDLDLLYHIPNGGHRHKSVARRLKAEGVKSGVPDLCLPVARGKYHGLYIELKYGKNKTSPSQDKWLAALAGQGYAAIVCYGWEDASKALVQYLGLGPFEWK